MIPHRGAYTFGGDDSMDEREIGKCCFFLFDFFFFFFPFVFLFFMAFFFRPFSTFALLFVCWLFYGITHAFTARAGNFSPSFFFFLGKVR